MVGAEEMVVLAIAEIREADRQRSRPCTSASDRRSLVSLPVRGLLLEVPLALLAPAESDRALRHHDLAGRLVDRRPSSTRDCWPRRCPREVGRAQEPLRHVVLALLHQTHQHRHVGVLAGVVAEIGRLPVDVELAQDDVAHAPWRAPRRCPASARSRGRRTSRPRNSPGRSRRSWRPCSGPRYRNGRRACASAGRSSPTGSGSRNCTSRPIPARRSARPRSAGEAGGRSQYQS